MDGWVASRSNMYNMAYREQNQQNWKKSSYLIFLFTSYLVTFTFRCRKIFFKPNICLAKWCVCNSMGIISWRSINYVSAWVLHGYNDQGHFTRCSPWCKDHPLSGSFTNKINTFTPINLKGCSCSCCFHYLGKKKALVIWNSVTLAYSENTEKMTHMDSRHSI